MNLLLLCFLASLGVAVSLPEDEYNEDMTEHDYTDYSEWEYYFTTPAYNYKSLSSSDSVGDAVSLPEDDHTSVFDYYYYPDEYETSINSSAVKHSPLRGAVATTYILLLVPVIQFCAWKLENSNESRKTEIIIFPTAWVILLNCNLADKRLNKLE